MYEYILECTRLVMNETTTSMSTIDPEMTKQVHVEGIVDSKGVGLRHVIGMASHNDNRNIESNSIQTVHLHILNSVLIMNFF